MFINKKLDELVKEIRRKKMVNRKDVEMVS